MGFGGEGWEGGGGGEGGLREEHCGGGCWFGWGDVHGRSLGLDWSMEEGGVV